MGLVKSAARMALTRRASLEELLRDLNDVLMPLKSSSMFVTAAAVESSPNGLRFSVAGHLPILHLRADTRAVAEVSVANLPLGFSGNQAYTTGSLNCRPGDLLALITDGLVEVFDRHDREFGLDAIKQVLVQTGARPLADVLSALSEAAHAHGTQLDDQSALVLRVLR
jgi:serine phosphatase RsbU (regulator of sigma subunit)